MGRVVNNTFGHIEGAERATVIISCNTGTPRLLDVYCLMCLRLPWAHAYTSSYAQLPVLQLSHIEIHCYIIYFAMYIPTSKLPVYFKPLPRVTVTLWLPNLLNRGIGHTACSLTVIPLIVLLVTELSGLAKEVTSPSKSVNKHVIFSISILKHGPVKNIAPPLITDGVSGSGLKNSTVCTGNLMTK